MARDRVTVRLSSKGQVVIPSSIRRKLGIGTGQLLDVDSPDPGQVVLRLIRRQGEAEEMLARAHATARKMGLSGVEDLHRRRKKERKLEAAKRERWRD